MGLGRRQRFPEAQSVSMAAPYSYLDASPLSDRSPTAAPPPQLRFNWLSEASRILKSCVDTSHDAVHPPDNNGSVSPQTPIGIAPALGKCTAIFSARRRSTRPKRQQAPTTPSPPYIFLHPQSTPNTSTVAQHQATSLPPSQRIIISRYPSPHFLLTNTHTGD